MRLFLFGLIFCQFNSTAAAQVQHAQDTRFADYLLHRKRYKEAFIEYQRSFILSPASRDSEAIERMFISGHLSNDPLAVIAIAGENELFDNEPGIDCLRGLHLARAYYDARNFDKGISVLPSARHCKMPEIDDRADYLESLIRMRELKWEDALTYLQRIPPSSALHTRAAIARENVLRGTQLPVKRPAVAGSLSAVVPGAGYLYTGHKQTALAALITNGLFLWGTVSAAKSGETGLVALGSAFSFAWYFGNIYGSMEAARRYNRTVVDKFIGSFELD